MAREPELHPDEHQALVAVLRRWKAEYGDWRAVGRFLELPETSSSQTLGNVAREGGKGPQGRVGRWLADRIYKHLGTTRESYLRSHGLGQLVDTAPGVQPAATREPTVEPDRMARVFRIAAELDRPASEALKVATELAAYKGEITDAQIAARFSPRPSRIQVKPRVVQSADDLGGGAADVPKLPKRRRK